MISAIDICLLVVFALYIVMAAVAQNKGDYEEAAYYQRYSVMLVIIMCMKAVIEAF